MSKTLMQEANNCPVIKMNFISLSELIKREPEYETSVSGRTPK